MLLQHCKLLDPGQPRRQALAQNGIQLCRRHRKVRFTWKMLPQICRIQAELWKNIPAGFVRK